MTDIWQYHNFTNTEEAAASVALNAGTDLECGQSYLKLNESLADGQVELSRIDSALTRLYNALFTVGFFDGSPYGSLGWSDVATPDAQALAYQAAWEGMTLLKNDDDFLPLGSTARKVAVIGPLANATTQLQGDYSGIAEYIISPLAAFENFSSWTVEYAMGTDINSNSTAGFNASLAAAASADMVIYVGGLDNSLEAETLDRKTLAWPGNQADLIEQLSAIGKPVVVLQMGGGQVDDTPLLNNSGVKAIIWGGYPSQSAGTALLDILTGKQAPAGRLPVTQYPASYADEVSIFDINLQPHGSYPGRTYRWYTGTAVRPFGFGMHYTSFDFKWSQKLKHTYHIGQLVDQCGSAGYVNTKTPFASVSIDVTNSGSHTSDYAGLLFLSSNNAGPKPRPIKTLVSYTRLHALAANEKQRMELPLTLGSLARADKNGDITIWPGDYELALDNDASLTFSFTLKGSPVAIETLPSPAASYNYTVPVHIQPPSTKVHT